MSETNLKNLQMYPLICNYKDSIDFVDKLLTIYSVIAMDKDSQLRKFEKDVLAYYIRFGYSSNTKKMIEGDLGKSSETITQATFYLKKKGYLVDSKTNMSRKNLNKDLQRLRDNFINSNSKLMAVGFKRKKKK